MRELNEKQETQCILYYSNTLNCIGILTKQSYDRRKEQREQLLWMLMGVQWKHLQWMVQQKGGR